MPVIEVIVNVVKPEHMAEALSLMVADYRSYLLARTEDVPIERSGRILTAPGGRIIQMYEWASLSDCERAWAAWFADPRTGMSLNRGACLLLEGGSHEFWELGPACGALVPPGLHGRPR